MCFRQPPLSSGLRTLALLGLIGVAAGAARGVTETAPALAAIRTAITSVEAGRLTTPIIGPATAGGSKVTFLAKRQGRLAPRIVSDVTGWGERADGTFDFSVGQMTRVKGTDWYALEAIVASGARIEYLVSYGREYRLDPFNPRRLPSPQASEVVVPGYVPPRELVEPRASPGGSLRETALDSQALGRRCRLLVYTPAGFHPGADFGAAVFHDVESSSARAGVVQVLDWLIAHRAIDPVVAAFVSSGAGGGDRPAGPALRTFLVDELPAWLSARYGTTKNPGQRALLAVSFGAKDALDAVVTSDRGYLRLGLLIPGRRLGSADLEAAGAPRTYRVRAAILAGRYDQANLDTARRVREALGAAGDRVDYVEVPEGHSPRTWLNHLGRVLVSLFGPDALFTPAQCDRQESVTMSGLAGGPTIGTWPGDLLMPTPPATGEPPPEDTQTVTNLRDLVTALDGRPPRSDVETERPIAREAATLRRAAVDRLEQLEDAPGTTR